MSIHELELKSRITSR